MLQSLCHIKKSTTLFVDYLTFQILSFILDMLAYYFFDDCFFNIKRQRLKYYC